MLNIQNKYLSYLSNIKKEITKTRLSKEIINNFSFEIKKEHIENTELLVPIIGAFSAGKSSLLNTFLGKKYLSVGLTPETALATELRYSEEEYIEAIQADETITKFMIDEIGNISEIAHQFKFLKIYINNLKLKEIEPLVLVDMPGFESPLDIHNQAIMEYINSGVHYIVLTSVEDGTITRSMVRQLTDIQEYGRDFSFFLSKTNLRAKSESEDIAENVKEQIEEYFDIEKDVVLIDDNAGESFQKILLAIDPEKLFEDLFIDDLKDNYYRMTEVLNTTISSLGKDKNKNQDVIIQLKSSLTKVQDERERLMSEANERYSNSNVNLIVEAVGKELSNSLDELVASTINSGQEGMSQQISEITRHTLLRYLKNSMNTIANDVIDNFSTNLSSINSSMSEFTMSDDWLDKITDSTKKMLDGTRKGIDNIIRKRNNSGNIETIYKTITTILGLTTNILAPILEVIIVFLPTLLGGIFEKYQQKKQEEQIRNTIMTQVIPSLKRELRSHIPEIFNQQVQELIENISNQFEGVIEEKKQIIEETQKELDEKVIDIDEAIALYREVSQNITTLANNSLYK